MNYQEICTQAIEIIKATGSFIRNERNKISKENIENKGIHDMVTYVDKTSEKMLIEGLQPLIPEAGFIAEEGTSSKKGDVFNWIIDPLDGTTNFIHGAPPFAISVALMENEELVIGIVYEISMNECFYSSKGDAAYLNGKEMSVSKTETIHNSLIATGFPYTDFERLEAFLGTLKDFFENSQGVRRLGSAATDLAYVACGRYDSFYEYNLKPWDVAAGAFLVQQAGGRNSDFSGGNNYVFGEEIASTNANTYHEFMKHVECLKLENFK